MSAKTDNKKKEPKAAPTGDAPAPAAKGGRGPKKPAAEAPVDNKASADQPQQQSSKGGRPSGARGGERTDRIPKPDVAERDAQLETITAEINKLKAERDAAQKKIAELIDASKGGNDERSKVRQEAAKIRDEVKRARDEKDVVLNQQKAAVAELEAKIAEERKAKEGLGKFTSVEAIDDEIKRIEKHMTSNNFTSKEEKDMIREMDKLRLSKKNIGALKAKVDEVQKARDAKKELDAKLNEKKAVVDEVQKRYQNIRDALTALDAKDKEGIGAALPALREKRDALNTQIEALLARKSAVYDDFKKKMNDFHIALEEKKKQEKERREAEEEKRKQEREERERIEAEKRQAIEEEEMKKKPWEAEIALCDVLIAYLERLQKSNNSGNASNSATSAPLAKKAGTDFGNLKPLVRGEDDDYFVGKKKEAKAPAAKEKASTKDKPAALTHSLDILNSFSLLSLIPPSNDAGIDASIAQLKEKRAYYDVLPRAPKPAKAQQAASIEVSNEAPEPTAASDVSDKTEKRGSRKAGNSNPPSVADASLFPHLPGSKPNTDAGESKQKWGPKPSDTTAEEVAEEVMEE